MEDWGCWRDLRPQHHTKDKNLPDESYSSGARIFLSSVYFPEEPPPGPFPPEFL